MYTMHIKNWFHGFHFPSAHDMGLACGRMFHNSHFWLGLAIAAIVVAMLWLMVLAFLKGQFTEQDLFNYGSDTFFYP